MANEIRLRNNNISGTITDNPLTNVSPTINSPGFVDLPVVGPTNHLILILDPLETNGAAEIVTVTAHSASASSVTVTRGAEGSIARTHVMGTTWFHGPVVSDFNFTDKLALSTNRPLTPVEGQLIYETDSNKYYGYTGTDWAPRDAGGQLGYAQAVANQGAITAEADVTGLSVAVTVGTGRRVKISAQLLPNSTTATDTIRMRIKEGATVLQFGQVLATAVAQSVVGSITVTPSAGAHTYKVSLAREVGAGTVTNNADPTFPSFILVEDVGAA